MDWLLGNSGQVLCLIHNIRREAVKVLKNRKKVAPPGLSLPEMAASVSTHPIDAKARVPTTQL